MISVREALDHVLRDLPRLGGEQVALTQAVRRVLAEEVRAARDVPPFRNSAMDGFAVRAEDVTTATPQRPVRLTVVETIGAGAVARRSVQRGTAVRIMTGAPVPDGADAVVRVEDVSTDAETEVAVRVAVRPGANVRDAGEDLRVGEVVLHPGRVLRPADIGLLASLGLAVVRVIRRPRVAVVVTGDELVEVGQPLLAGQIVNSNAYTLAAAIEEAGGEALMLGIVRDDAQHVRSAFADAFHTDVVLSTGGVSVGSFDLVRGILSELGYREEFWKVAQKPGKPLTFGSRSGVPVFGLPGNPVSSLVCFYVYVVPALRTMVGISERHLPCAEATLEDSINKAPGLTEFVRCSLDGPPHGYRARSTGSQSSGVLRSLSLGDGLIVGPPEKQVLERGSRVRVMLLAPDRGSAEGPV